MQPQVDFVAAMAASRAAVPSLDPYIVAEAGQGVAYRALPSPKGSVLNAVSTTISDLNTRFEQVLSRSCHLCLPCKLKEPLMVPVGV